MIGFNTYNVFVIDLQHEDKLIKYWHESYALWESPVRGFLLTNNDFLMISKDGIQLLAIGRGDNRVIKDSDGQKRMIHSLGSLDYLKLERRNHIYFSCQFYNDRQIWVQEQYHDKVENDKGEVTNGETHFKDIYKIKLEEPTLRELLLIQSIYVNKSAGGAAEIVKW